MGKDMSLNAQVDPFGHQVVLTVRGIRGADLKALAQMAAVDSEALLWELQQLAKALNRPAAGWDEAVIDFEANTGMAEPVVELDEVRASALASEIATEAAKTLSARARRVSYLPPQKGAA